MAFAVACAAIVVELRSYRVHMKFGEVYFAGVSSLDRRLDLQEIAEEVVSNPFVCREEEGAAEGRRSEWYLDFCGGIARALGEESGAEGARCCGTRHCFRTCIWNCCALVEESVHVCPFACEWQILSMCAGKEEVDGRAGSRKFQGVVCML
eukprot:TRINITY_DN3746_c0_g1_i2.p1 TRINITY_DN3746_c0_g1~~TRINITY_DN3746_c0_g1_i2.p1  ORF type:complete len:151 (-),score=18.42 TRINITY_DN3746_c0_g1_i2:208-660(-)